MILLSVTRHLEVLFVLLLLLIFASGCVTTPEVESAAQTVEVPAELNESALNIEKSKSLIETGMLKSLLNARTLLAENNLTVTEQGRELDYIAYSLITLVYPYYGESLEPVTALRSSIYPDIVDTVRSGTVPKITEEGTSFFTLMFAAATVFYNSSRDVLDRCFEITTQIASFSSNNLYSRLIKAKIDEEEGNLKDSMNEYSEILLSEPDCYPALLGKAKINVKEKEYISAIRILEELYRTYPGGKDIASLLVDSYLYTGEIVKANKLLENVLIRDPDDIDLALKRARTLLASGQTDQAGKLITIFESEKGESGESIYIRALLQIQIHHFTKAETIIKEGIVKYPGYLPLVVAYGRLFIETGQFEKAQIYLESRLKENQDDPDLLKLLMISYIKRKMWGKSAPIVEKLLDRVSPPEILRYAVEIFYNLGRYGKAFSYNKELLILPDPAMEDYLYRVKLLVQQNKKKKALSEITNWISASDNPSERSEFYYSMSLCTNDPQKQQEYLQQALFENLQNLNAIVALADLYERQSEYRKAYRYLKQAAIIDPGNRDIKERLRKLEKKL